MTELEKQIAECAIKEVEQPTLGTVEQYLEVHEIVYENGRPKIARVDTDDPETAIVYFPVKDEEFFYALTVSPKELKCWGMYSEPYTSAYLIASSDTDSKEQLMACTSMQPVRIWNKGELRGPRRIACKFTALHFEPHPGADTIEDKIRKLLDYMDEDREGVKKLTERYYTGLQVAMNFQSSYSVGGIHLDAQTTKRIAALGLSIDFDLYFSGNELKDSLE